VRSDKDSAVPEKRLHPSAVVMKGALFDERDRQGEILAQNALILFGNGRKRKRLLQRGRPFLPNVDRAFRHSPAAAHCLKPRPERQTSVIYFAPVTTF
jgi:hypothetical protein